MQLEERSSLDPAGDCASLVSNAWEEEGGREGARVKLYIANRAAFKRG